MKLEIRRLTPAERDRVRRAILADMEERGDLCCTRREWMASAFLWIRGKVVEGWSFDFVLDQMIDGPRLRRHNRQIQERLAKGVA